MIRPPRSDFWRVGILPRPIGAFLDAGHPPSRLAEGIKWLPDPGPWRYLADPFGLQRGKSTHVFVEAFDYRTKHAVIEHHELGPGLEWRGKATVLRLAHHASYPFLVEENGEVFMIPECHRANEVALYRAEKFPDTWVREATLLPGIPAAEASVLQHEGRWWMFFTIVGPGARDQRELHLAHADRLTGPWQLHADNPVRNDPRGARPGGTPFVVNDGTVILPVQDCGETYGGAVRFLRFSVLEPTRVIVAPLATRLTGGMFSPTHQAGCHTCSACGDLTLVDTKRIVHSWGRHAINLRRRLFS